MKKTKIIAVFGVLLILLCVLSVSALHVASPVSVDEGKESVMKFIGDDDLKLSDLKFQKEVDYFSNGDYYQYSTDKINAYVNKYSGDVEQIVFYDKRCKEDKDAAIKLHQAEKIAKKYAADKYPGFDKMNMVCLESEYLDHMGGGKEYTFLWRESENDILTLNYVTICVDAVNGEVYSYMSNKRDYAGSMTPKLSEDEAYAVALKEFPGIEVTDKSCILSVEFIGKNFPSLVYTLTLKGKPVDNTLYGGIVMIDAESGKVIFTSPYQ